MVYTFIFFTAFDCDDFVTTSARVDGRNFKVVARLDRRTLNVRFRKGTKASKVFGLANVWNADVVGLSC